MTSSPTSDPNIRAIGECVQHRGQAKQLSGADPDAVYTGTRQITRLKADGIDLLTMGDVDVPSDDLEREVLTIADPTRGRYGKVVIRDDRLVGAVSLGNPDTTGLLSQLFDSQSTVPSDRMSLLLGHAYTQTAQTRPEDLPDTAVICRCNTVTKNQIVDSWTAGHRTLQAVIDHTRATTGCGSCADTVHALCTRLSRAA